MAGKYFQSSLIFVISGHLSVEYIVRCLGDSLLCWPSQLCKSWRVWLIKMSSIKRASLTLRQVLQSGQIGKDESNGWSSLKALKPNVVIKSFFNYRRLSTEQEHTKGRQCHASIPGVQAATCKKKFIGLIFEIIPLLYQESEWLIHYLLVVFNSNLSKLVLYKKNQWHNWIYVEKNLSVCYNRGSHHLTDVAKIWNT